MLSFPFRLADRIRSDGSNDLEVVRQLDVAMQAADGRAPAEVPRAQDAVLDELRGWQADRGLVPDGEARPGGPTEARLNAAA
ncbi:MAG: hypothetical protein VYB54_12600 [Pseudomonadota bacterium]|nr:hypothetical protein [Pseudomonadota bacterium]